MEKFIKHCQELDQAEQVLLKHKYPYLKDLIEKNKDFATVTTLDYVTGIHTANTYVSEKEWADQSFWLNQVHAFSASIIEVEIENYLEAHNYLSKSDLDALDYAEIAQAIQEDIDCNCQKTTDLINDLWFYTIV